MTDWWIRWPDASIAMATGPVSGHVVLDIDHADGFTVLKDKGFDLPTTSRVITGKGLAFQFSGPRRQEEKFYPGQV